MHKYGGLEFCLVYIICLIFLGVPMIFLEFSLGQFCQRSHYNVWKQIHPRLKGIGIATTYANLLLLITYNVLIAWCVVMMFSCGYDPLPWSATRAVDCISNSTNAPIVSITEQYFYRDILHIINNSTEEENCTKFDTSSQFGTSSTFCWEVFLG